MKESRLHTRFTEEEKLEFDKIQKDLGFRNQSDFIMAAVRTLHDIDFLHSDSSVMKSQIVRAIEQPIRDSEKRLGNRFAKLMSENLVQVAIISTILKMNNHLTDMEIEQVRSDVMKHLKYQQSVLKYGEL